MRQKRQILEDAYDLKELAKIHFHPETLRYRIRLSKQLKNMVALYDHRHANSVSLRVCSYVYIMIPVLVTHSSLLHT